MKAKLLLIAAAIAVVATINLSLGFYTDTVEYLTFQQPNEVSFQARYWGDEFEWHMESSDGYAIVYNGADHYYYYAQLDSAGEYCCTNLKVNIDSPEGLPLHLDRSAERKAQIQDAIDQFKSDAELAREWFIAWQDTSSRDFLNVGVFLVELADKQTENLYTIDDFERMLSSVNEYNTYLSQGQVKSPVWNEDVCGSVRDYYNEVSGGRFYPLYSVINPPDPLNPTKPIWLEISGTWASYGLSSLITATINAAVDSGWSSLMQDYDDICVIIADHHIEGEPGGPISDVSSGYTNSQMPGVSGAYIMWEEWGNGFNLYYPFSFAHVGCHCHIYGHMLGLVFNDIGGNSNARQFMLMGTGNNPGENPDFKEQCPSHMGIAEKFELNWITLSGPNQELFDITENYVGENELVIPYRTDGHRWYYRFTCPNCPQTDDVFFLENRRYDGQGLPWPNGQDFNSFLIGHDETSCPRNMLLIHRCWNAWPGLSYYDYGELLCADNHIDYTDPYHRWWLGDWGDPFPGIDGIDSLSPMSPEVTEYDPQWPGLAHTHDYHTTPKDHFGHQTGFAMFNIRSETDGIHADVYHNYWAGNINTTTTWSGNDIVIGGPGITLTGSPTDLIIEPQSIIEFREGTRIVAHYTNHVILQSDIERDFFIEGNLKIDENVTVRDGATLTIYPGSQVRFAPGKKLTIEGRLIAIGAQENPIAFCRYGVEQYEGTIIDHTGLSPTQDSEIKYCTITGARVGIMARSTSKLVVEHCEITDNVYGIYGSTTGATLAPKIRYNTISDNSVYGIAMYGMDDSGWIYYNTLDENTQGNVYLSDSDPYYYGRNVHLGPAAFGLLCDGNSSPRLRYSASEPNGGFNNFGGCTFGIITRATARPELGRNITDTPGYNAFFVQDRYMLDNRGDQTIWAEVNYWYPGVDPETQNPPIWQYNGLGEDFGGSCYMHELQFADLLGLGAQSLVFTARGNEGGAIGVFRDTSNPEMCPVKNFSVADGIPGSHPQLTWLPSEEQDADRYDVYRALMPDETPPSAEAFELLVTVEHPDTCYIDSTVAIHTQYDNYKIWYAAKAVDTADQESLWSSFVRFWGYYENNGGFVETVVSGLEVRLSHLQVAPNPCNNETHLVYDLRQASLVKLQLVDAGGRIIAILHEGWAEAGEHSIAINAHDLPSGIYYACLVTNGNVAIQKLAILK